MLETRLLTNRGECSSSITSPSRRINSLAENCQSNVCDELVQTGRVDVFCILHVLVSDAHIIHESIPLSPVTEVLEVLIHGPDDVVESVLFLLSYEN